MSSRLLTISLKQLVFFPLFIFPLVLAGCQPQENTKNFSHGLFHSKMTNGRKPASLSPLNYDEKVMYISCLNSFPKNKNNSAKNCYIDLTSEVNKETLSYEEVQEKVNSLTKVILNELAPQVEKHSSVKKKYCLKTFPHNKLNYDKCLTKKVSQDGVSILNRYQQNKGQINPHEYLYLKNIIEGQLVSYLK
jgi:hypothetical protein